MLKFYYIYSSTISNIQYSTQKSQYIRKESEEEEKSYNIIIIIKNCFSSKHIFNGGKKLGKSIS